MRKKEISLKKFPGHIRRIFGFVWLTHPSFALGLIVLQFLQGVMPVAAAWVTKEIFDILGETSGGIQSQFLNLFLGLLLFRVILGIASNILNQLNSYLNSELDRRLTLTTEEKIYRKLLSFKGLSYFENSEYHELFLMASHGLQMGTNKIIGTLTLFIQSIITLVSFAGVILFLNPLMMVILFVANIPHLYQHLRFGQERVSLKQNINPKERTAYYFSHLLSNLQFAKEIRLFNIGDYFLEHLLDIKQNIHREQREQEIREIRANSGLHLLSTLVTTAMFAFIIYQAYLGQISIGDVMLYTAALTSIGGAIGNIIRAFATMNEQVLFFQHYTEFQALKPALQVASQPRTIPPLSHGIEFRNVAFRYSEKSPYVLRHIDLFIPARQNLALVGLNGSGKTTLVKLLTRLYDPTDGQILWDGIDIREFNVDDYRQHIAAIFQDFVRYDLTARENIGLGNIKAIHNIPSIRNAATKTGIHNYIQSLPDQYESILSRWLASKGEGNDLSGGQWQKIAIARMFMRDTDFLILDEPAAALDAEAEYEIFSQFATLVENRTSLLISHRFSTVRMADHIAVLHNGRITEQGSHAELMALNQHYKDLYSKQAMHYQT